MICSNEKIVAFFLNLVDAYSFFVKEEIMIKINNDQIKE